MNLDITNWKEFRLGRLISDIYKSKALNKDELVSATDDKNSIRYITRTGDNNGCEMLADISFVDITYIQKGNAITIGDTTATCFYQSDDFITGDHIVVVRANWLDEILGLYIVTILNKEQYKYSYGRAFLMERIKKTLIKLPIKMNADSTPFIDISRKYSDEGYVPDWKWMKTYIKSLHYKVLTTKNSPQNTYSLNLNRWKEFNVNKLFSISIAKSADIGNLEEGSTAFVGRTNLNNGIQGFVEPQCITEGKCITISMVGTNVALYQENDFQASQNIAVLRNEMITPGNAMFICSVINFEMNSKYSYGRTVGKSNIEEMTLFLPIARNLDGEPLVDDKCKYSRQGYIPDWQWMEDYIKALPYGDRL